MLRVQLLGGFQIERNGVTLTRFTPRKPNREVPSGFPYLL